MPDKKRFLKNMAYANMVADGIDPIAAQQYLNGEYKEGIKTDTEASKRNAKAAAATLGVIGAIAAAPAVFPVLMNPVTAKTAVGAGTATLLDAYGVTSGIKGLSGAFDKARYGSFKWRDVPELGLNLTTLIPGSSVLTTPKNIATAARTANNIYQKGKLAVDTAKEVKGLTTFVPTENKVIPLSRPISEAERLGIPKDMRSNPKALEDPYYWGYQQWNNRYNDVVETGNWDEAQRLRDLHFTVKAPNTKIIDEAGMPKEVYHGSGEKFTVFDSSKTRPDYDYGTSTNMFSDNKNVALGYAKNDPDKLHSVYLNLQNILERDFKGNPWNGSVNNSGKFQIIPEYGTTYSSEQEAEAALQKILDRYYPNDPVKQAEQRHYMYVTELMDPPHPERSTNAFSDEIAKSSVLDGGIVRNVKDYYDLPIFDENPELYKELTSPHIDYFVKDPRNIKSSAIITRDDFGRIIPIVKRDNFHNPDVRYKQGGNI